MIITEGEGDEGEGEGETGEGEGEGEGEAGEGEGEGEAGEGEGEGESGEGEGEGEGETGEGEGEGETGEGEGEAGEGEGEGEGESNALLCGDAVQDFGEECDDGARASGDDCNAICQIEDVVAELEPNDDVAAAAATGILFGGFPTTYPGSLLAGEHDIVGFDVGTPRVVQAQMYEGIDGPDDCGPGLLVTMTVRDVDGGFLTEDSSGGIGACSGLAFEAPAFGFLDVDSDDSDDIPFRLVVTLPQDVGVEAEPNDVEPEQAMFGALHATIRGTIESFDDEDRYAIVVPPGFGVRVETTGVGTPGCEIDTTVRLRDALGDTFATDNDGGRGTCSKIEGRGASPEDPEALNADGVDAFWTIEVDAAAEAAPPFDYHLVVLMH